MSDTSESTPRPWRFENPWAGFSALRGPNDELIFGIAIGAEHERQPEVTCDANARLIVRAVNEFQSLTQCAEALPLVTGILRTVCGNMHPEAHAACEQAEAALAALRAVRERDDG